MTGRDAMEAQARPEPAQRRWAPHWPARTIAAIAVAEAVVGALVSLGLTSRTTLIGGMIVGVVAAYAIVGVLIIERRPGNRVGSVILAMAVLVGGYLVADTLALQPGNPPGAALAAAAVTVLGGPFFAAIGALFLLFPDGHLPSPRWRVVARLTILCAIATAIGAGLTPGRFGYYPEVENPFGLVGFPGFIVSAPFYLGVIGLVVVSALSLVGRWRRGGPAERAQLKWVAFAAGGLALTMGTYIALVGPSVVYSEVGDFAFRIGQALFPIGIGIAILRYHLYDIDRVISRTLAYASLTAILAAVYLAGFLALQAVLASYTSGGGPIAVAASTLAVFALFQPLRGRLKLAMDRRFNRSRYDAQQIVEAFAARLRDEVDIGRLDDEIQAVMKHTVAPVHAQVWLRGAER
jgi:hypothetical protein